MQVFNKDEFLTKANRIAPSIRNDIKAQFAQKYLGDLEATPNNGVYAVAIGEVEVDGEMKTVYTKVEVGVTFVDPFVKKVSKPKAKVEKEAPTMPSVFE